MDRRSRLGPEPTTLEAVGNQWRYALVVVQAEEEEEYYANTAKLIFTKFGGKVACGLWRSSLDFDGNLGQVTLRLRVTVDVPRHTRQDFVVVAEARVILHNTGCFTRRLFNNN